MRLTSLALCLLPLLGGCLQDTASYTFPEKDHAITLVRNQTWPWQDTLSLEVVAIRLPECSGGGRIEGITLDAKLFLYRAPAEYAEPLFILRTGKKSSKRSYAISTQSCRFQTFKEPPEDFGVRLGVFKEVDGVFQFVPATTETEKASTPEASAPEAGK